MKIGFARFNNGNPYAYLQPKENTFEAYAKDLDFNNPGMEIALDFFTEAPPEEHNASIAALDAFIGVSETFRDGIEWLLGSVYALGVARGKQEALAEQDTNKKSA